MNLNIYAPAAGKVVLAEELTIKGKAILIDHGWGVFSGYWHMSEFDVSVGDFVQSGDLLGQIGNTGRSAGPHLHFEIDISGTPVNPMSWLSQEFP
jgi:murein DD-endopeptidase MepM/ murein hydrolase activator NlpD